MNDSHNDIKDFLPVMSQPLIDWMKSNKVIQMWVSALSSNPEMLVPVVSIILPELNSLLHKLLYMLSSYSLKLLGKHISKSHPYCEDKESKSKNLLVNEC